MASYNPNISNGTCYYSENTPTKGQFIPCGNEAIQVWPCCQVGSFCLGLGDSNSCWDKTCEHSSLLLLPSRHPWPLHPRHPFMFISAHLVPLQPKIGNVQTPGRHPPCPPSPANSKKYLTSVITTTSWKYLCSRVHRPLLHQSRMLVQAPSLPRARMGRHQPSLQEPQCRRLHQ